MPETIRRFSAYFLPVLIASVAFLFNLASEGNAANGIPRWAGDVAVTTAPGQQGTGLSSHPGLAIVSDAASGAIITWDDSNTLNVFAQRVTVTGVPAWTTGGVLVAPSSWPEMSPNEVSDGAGGSIIAWIDGRNGFCDPSFLADCAMYAQRVDSAGNALWTFDGVPINTAGNPSKVAMTSDGEGGAIMSWVDNRNGDCCRIYAQAVDSSGMVKWTPEGIPISAEPTLVQGPIPPPQIVSDGFGGAIIAWVNFQVHIAVQSPTLNVQHISSNGNLLWQDNGISLGAASREEFAVVSDGSSGAIVAWERAGADQFADITAQRIDPYGRLVWPSGGVPVVTAHYQQLTPSAASDGVGGAIIAWADERNGTVGDCMGFRRGNCDIYAQRISATGLPLWRLNGRPISTARGVQDQPIVVSDGYGGVVIEWKDCRNRPGHCDTHSDIYAQRVTPAGRILWKRNGTPVSVAPGNQGIEFGLPMGESIAATTDQIHGAISAWPDGRNGFCAATLPFTECDVYAQRINDGE
jgi:hypothetical protein